MWHKQIFVSENIWIDICHTLDQSSNISLLPRLRPQLDKVTEDSDLVLNLRTGTLLLVRPHNFCMGEQILGGEFGLILRLHHQLTAYDDWEKQCGKKKQCFHISAQVWLLSPQRSPTKQVNLALLPKLIVTLLWKWKAVGFCWFSHFLTSPHYGPQYGAQLHPPKEGSRSPPTLTTSTLYCHAYRILTGTQIRLNTKWMNTICFSSQR